MLNLTIVMFAWIFSPRRAAALLLACTLGFAALLGMAGQPRSARAQSPESTPTALEQAAIYAPLPGEALQGVMSIRGASALNGFRSAEVAFAYQSDPTNTWFLLQHSDQPVIDGPLAAWDTTTITDGNYRLRLLVYRSDGRVDEHIVDGLRVRNYSPIETSVPAPQGQATQPAQGLTAPTLTTSPLPDFQPAAPSSLRSTPAPTNPAQITRADLGGSALRGGLIALAAIFLVAAYMGLRALLRR